MSALSVSYTRTDDVRHIHTGSAALGDLTIDDASVAEDQRSGTAKQLLA